MRKNRDDEIPTISAKRIYKAKTVAQRKKEWIQKSKKTLISLRLDEDILEWLKSKGRGYQSRINKLLRKAMEISTLGEK
ncbi:BrnA antitoxin family protein [Candidatus Riflebacteria bacterium]